MRTEVGANCFFTIQPTTCVLLKHNKQLKIRSTELTQVSSVLRSMQRGQKGRTLQEVADTVGPNSHSLLNDGEDKLHQELSRNPGGPGSEA